jgi:chromosome segregation ATPase
MSDANLLAALEFADQYMRKLVRESVVRDQRIKEGMRRIAELERHLAKQQALSKQLQDRVDELEEQLEASMQRESALEEECRGLAGETAELETHLAATRKTSIDEFSTEVFESLDDDYQEALRHRVRCEQALRARLAKTNMTPWARLRTLQQALEYGMLDPRLKAELRALQDEDW